VENAFDFPGFVPAFIRPLFAKARDRSAGLSVGRSKDIAVIDDAVFACSPRIKRLRRWIVLAREKIKFQGLRPDLLAGLSANGQAGPGDQPLGAARRRSPRPSSSAATHLDSGSVASPYRETEAMKTAPMRWPTGRSSTALLNTASGRHGFSFHHGGGVGMGYSLHAGQGSWRTRTKEWTSDLARIDERSRHRRGPARGRGLSRSDLDGLKREDSNPNERS